MAGVGHQHHRIYPYDGQGDETLEEAFIKFSQDPSIAILVISQDAADEIRSFVHEHCQRLLSRGSSASMPMVVEIPSKTRGYDPLADSLLSTIITVNRK